MRTTHIEIVRYTRKLVIDNSESSAEEDRLTVNVTPEHFDVDANRLDSSRLIEHPKPTVILRLRKFLTRGRE